jgi:hypothetical protein
MMVLPATRFLCPLRCLSFVLYQYVSRGCQQVLGMMATGIHFND